MEGNGSPASQPKCFKLLRPLVNDVQASGGPGTDWHLPGKSLFYGFMLISCWKMSATNCICVDPQAFCRMILALTLEPIFQKKNTQLFIYFLSNPSASLLSNSCSLWSVILQDIDRMAAGSFLACYQAAEVGFKGYADNWVDEQHSVGFPSCQSHLGCCCQGHHLKCRWHSRRQHPLYKGASDCSWLSYIIIPSNLIV